MSRKFGNLALLLAVVLGLSGGALASSTATVTVNGSEHAGDVNTITVSFNGFVETAHYGQYSTEASIASTFGAMFSRDYLKDGLCAHAIGNVITFQLRGAASFGTLDVTGSTNSFQLQGSGFATQVSKTVDTGTVALTVGGVVIATTNYGDGATPSSIAEDLAAGTTSGSSVNVTAVNDAVYIKAKTTGAGTNYSYTIQTTSYDSTDFSQPSFANPPPTGSLSGGADANSGGGQQTIYSYSIPSYVSGSQPTGYDAAGNVVGYTDSVMGGWGFAYDTLNRLQSSSVTSGAYASLQIGWGFDTFGNRTSESFSGSSGVLLPTSSSASYNTNNQVNSSSLMGGVALGYDPSGDVTSDNQNQYLYDGDGRMCAVRNLTSGAMAGYIYGADGTRVSTGTISTWGSCDPTANGYVAMKDSILGPSGGQLTEVAMDANGNMAWSHTNVWVGGQLLATYDLNGLHFYLTDWTGSRRVQTDYEGVVEQTCANLPYGDGVTCGSDPANELFAGLERDSESGLDHAMFRQYSSTFGRWTSPDPYGGSSSVYDPQSLNRYAYVNGSPLGAADPSGLCPLCLVFNGSSGAAAAGTADTFLGGLLGEVLGPIGVLADAGEAIADIGQSLGWWSFGPTFHGNTAASQSGKYVFNVQAFVPEPDSSSENAETAWGAPLEPLEPLAPGEIVPGLPPYTWNTLTEPGPLSKPGYEDVLESFSGQQYTQFVVPKDGFGMDVYRSWGGKSTEEGSPRGVYYSFAPPLGPLQSLLDNAIMPRWNSAVNVQCVFLPPGTITYVGISAPQQGAFLGGNIQIYVPRP
jgi:RHS repeat-associated protein